MRTIPARKMIFKKGLTALAAIGLALFALLPIQPATAQSTATTQSATSSQVKPTIVLVHGAWADGSSWAPVSAILRAQGYTVLVPPNPLRGLGSDAASLSAFIQQATSGPVVLVGHSYGGAVITNAATSDPTVKALVYVDAFAPAQGQTLGQIINGSTSALNVPDPTTVFTVVADPNFPAEDVDLYLKPATFNNAFAQDLPSAVRNILSPAQRPLAFGAIREPSGAPAWATIPSWFVVGTLDKVIPQTTQLQMAAAAGGQVTKVNASHLSMLSKPLQVAQVITQAARTVR